MAAVYMFVCKQMTAYEMRISDWSSDVCSSELADRAVPPCPHALYRWTQHSLCLRRHLCRRHFRHVVPGHPHFRHPAEHHCRPRGSRLRLRSEEHTSELQSLMRISYAVFCLKQKKTKRKEHRKQVDREYNI